MYNSDKWINEYDVYDCDGMEVARQRLLNYVSKLNGVKIINNDSGVKCVEVITKNATYTYTIHAYYGDGCYGARVYSMTAKYSRDKWRDILEFVKEN